MRAPTADVLILGAGAAGLAAASELARTERSALVLEARERIGGRIWTRDEPGFAVPLELGAEFIHGQAEATFDLLGRHGNVAVDAPTEHWITQRGRLQPMDDYFGDIRKALESARPSLRSKDTSLANLLERIEPKKLPTEAREFARMLVEGFDAADPSTSERTLDRCRMEWRGRGECAAVQTARRLSIIAGAAREPTRRQQRSTARAIGSAHRALETRIGGSGRRAAGSTVPRHRQARHRDFAARGLKKVFGSRDLEPELVSTFMHDWQRDPFARGAYSYVMVGGGHARVALAEPVEDTLLFAGEAADINDAGTVAGALASGRDAARLAVR